MPTRCRLCLTQCKDDELKPMLATWNDSINLWTMYDYVMNVGDNVHSATIPYSCMKCKEDLKSAYDFKLMCVETERTLSELLAKNEQSANESETENVSCNDDDDFIAEDVNLFEEECNEEDAEKKCIEASTDEVTIDETKDKDLWDISVDENIKQVQAIEEVGSEPTNTKLIPLKCRKCDMEFDKKKDYQAHYTLVHRRAYQRKIHKDRPQSCQKCNIKFENLHSYQAHYRRHHQRPIQPGDNDRQAAKVICTICGRLLGKRGMAKHIQKMHSNDPKKEHTCTICGKSFKWIENLNQHARIHVNDRRFECKICGEKFLHWASRSSHITTKHTGEKK